MGALNGLGTCGGDDLTRRGVAGDRDEADRRVAREGVADDRAATGHHVEHTCGEDVGCQLGQAKRGERCDLRRLDDRGIAGGQGRAELPDGHHQGVVPRADADGDAQWLPADHGGEAPLVLPGRLALLTAGSAGEKAQAVGHERDVALRDRDRLADIDGFEPGKLGCIGVDGIGEPEEHGAALFGRCVEPDLVVGPLRRAHRTSDILRAGDGNLGDRLAGGRVDVVICLAFGGIHPLPADEQRAVLLHVLLHGAALLSAIVALAVDGPGAQRAALEPGRRPAAPSSAATGTASSSVAPLLC